jgi:SAM-dependent methyltransferase
VRPDLPSSPAAERNKDPILEVLRAELPAQGRVLEIASGTGQHVCHFAQALPDLLWQPTEADETQHAVIAQRIRDGALRNVEQPIRLNVLADWPVTGPYDALVCINMIHISPWPATLALLGGAARVLAPGGKLVLYGPYLEGGTAVPSNLEFDASLKRRNPEWGLREIEAVTRVAMSQELQPRQIVRMPANNLSLVFTRSRG